MKQPGGASAADQILATVRAIPRGKVCTYGQIATRAGLPRRARLVGTVLRNAGDPKLPWQRVIGACGQLTKAAGEAHFQRQRRALEAEGVKVSDSGRVDLHVHGWRDDPLPLLPA